MLLQNGRANGALRKLGAVQEGVLRRSVRRDGEYFDQVLWSMLERGLGRTLGVRPVRGCTDAMKQLPLAARLYVTLIVAAGAVCWRSASPTCRSSSRCCSSRCWCSRRSSAGAQGHAAAHRQRLDDVGVLRGRLRVAAAPRAARDDARRRGQRAQPVPDLNQQGTQPAPPHALQHGVARDHGAGRGPGARLLGDRRPGATGRRRIARPLVGAATVYFLVNTGSWRRRSRCRPASASRTSGTPTSSGARRATSSAPAPPRSPPGSSRSAGYWLAPLDVRAALPDLPHLQGLHGPHRGRAAPRAADLGPAPGDHRSAGARHRRQGSDDADAHPPRAGLRGGAREGRRPAAERRSRASRRRRCCTTSASSPCPSTSCRSPDR